MILIRHGESAFNVVFSKTGVDPGIIDPPLTAHGRTQAAAAATMLRAHGLRRILTSPYTRAVETAEILRDTLDIPISVDPIIGERAHFTCDIGTPTSILAKRWPHIEFTEMPELWWPENEGLPRLKQRGAAFRDRAKKWDDAEHLLAVSHWAFIRSLTGAAVANCAMVSFDPHE